MNEVKTHQFRSLLGWDHRVLNEDSRLQHLISSKINMPPHITELCQSWVAMRNYRTLSSLNLTIRTLKSYHMAAALVRHSEPCVSGAHQGRNLHQETGCACARRLIRSFFHHLAAAAAAATPRPPAPPALLAAPALIRGFPRSQRRRPNRGLPLRQKRCRGVPPAAAGAATGARRPPARQRRRRRPPQPQGSMTSCWASGHAVHGSRLNDLQDTRHGSE